MTSGSFFLLYFGRKRYLHHLPVLSYCWSLGFIASVIGVSWAIDAGALDNHGDPKTDTGHFIASIISAITDLAGELYFVGCFLSLSIGPQILSYIICAIFGRAVNLYLLPMVTRLSMWSLVKTLATGSGIFMAIGAIICIRSVDYFMFLNYTVISFMFIMMALLSTILYSTSGVIVTDLSDPDFSNLSQPFKSVNRWATRNARVEDGPT